MTFAMLDKIVTNVLPKELQTKVIFDNVDSQTKKMPEFVDSGLLKKTGDSDGKPQLNGIHCVPIIADSPNFRKEIGVSMSDEGFIKLPRTLLSDPNWKGLRVKYQRLFLIILEHTAYRSRNFSYNGHAINVNPGQLCISYRRLVDLYNDGVKFKADRIDVPFIQRAVSVFTKFGFSIQESIHDISLLTIKQRELYDHFQKQTDTPSDTDSIQTRYSNEERKEREDMKETIDRAIAPDRSFLLDKEKKEQENKPSIFDAPEAPTRKDQKLTPEQQKQYEDIWQFLCKSQMADGTTTKNSKGKLIKGITPQDVVTWLKTREFKEIVEAIKTTKDANVQTNYPAYLVTLFKKNVVAKKDNIQINDEFLNEITKIHKCLHLENHKQYVTDRVKHTDYQKNSDPQRFKEMIMASIAMASNYDQRHVDQEIEKEYEEEY